jgi:hypothetical protein
VRGIHVRKSTIQTFTLLTLCVTQSVLAVYYKEADRIMGLGSPRWLPIITIAMSIPLLLSYNIKHFAFPAGYPYVVLYTWGLLSVLIVPILLLIECVVTFRILFSQYVGHRRSALFWNILALGVASIAELTFIIVRNDPS